MIFYLFFIKLNFVISSFIETLKNSKNVEIKKIDNVDFSNCFNLNRNFLENPLNSRCDHDYLNFCKEVIEEAIIKTNEIIRDEYEKLKLKFVKINVPLNSSAVLQLNEIFKNSFECIDLSLEETKHDLESLIGLIYEKFVEEIFYIKTKTKILKDNKAKDLYKKNRNAEKSKNPDKKNLNVKTQMHFNSKQKNKELLSVEENAINDSNAVKSFDLRLEHITIYYNILIDAINHKIELEGNLLGRKFSSITDKKYFFAFRLLHCLVRNILQSYKNFVLGRLNCCISKLFTELQYTMFINSEIKGDKAMKYLRKYFMRVNNYLDKIFEKREQYLLNNI